MKVLIRGRVLSGYEGKRIVKELICLFDVMVRLTSRYSKHASVAKPEVQANVCARKGASAGGLSGASLRNHGAPPCNEEANVAQEP